MGPRGLRETSMKLQSLKPLSNQHVAKKCRAFKVQKCTPMTHDCKIASRASCDFGH